ncbi:hypothetical protein AB3M83_02915 [Microbacterium sp. 179-B 1A2 NHS]|uniref:hypothetical protein n=1 Tax=Microbacterium sp. 179-B 1A2 NHS TaxID=3142383 RepID=UPI0039A013BA
MEETGTAERVAPERTTWRRRAVGPVIAAGVIVAAVVIGAVVWSAGPPAPPAPVAERSTPPAPGPDPDATPVDGSEVQPPDATSRSAGVPLMTPEPPLFDGSLPASGSARGELVDGYPDALAGPVEGDEVLESSVASEGTTLQATVTARSEKAPDAVRAALEKRWAAVGLASEAGAGETETTYGGSSAAMTLSVSAGGTGTVYSIVAVLRTE